MKNVPLSNVRIFVGNLSGILDLRTVGKKFEQLLVEAQVTALSIFSSFHEEGRGHQGLY